MPKLRDSIMRQRRGGDIETFTDENDRGDLTMWQEGGYDMDPTQYGIQDKPYEFGPPDETTPPIFMTNIPQGGMGPSYESPGGVPGSELDRADIDARAAEAGVDVMDLSQKKKISEPPAWVDPDVDLNVPGARDRFRQILVEDVQGGFDKSTMNINAEMGRSNLDPVIDKKAWDERFDRLTKEKAAATTLMEQLMKPFDRAAAQQLAIRKRKAETAAGQAELREKDEKRLIELSSELVKLAGERRKLKKDQTEAGQMGDTTEMVSINRLNAQVDSQQKRVQSEIDRLETKLGRKAPAQVVAAPPKDATTVPQTEAQKFAAEGKAKGWSPEQTLAEWKKLKSGGESSSQMPGPAAAPISSGAAGSFGPPPPQPLQPENPNLPSAIPQPPMPDAGMDTGMNTGMNIGGPPVTIDTESMKNLAMSLGLTMDNLKTYLQVAADINGSTVDLLLTKPYNTIKQLLKQAVDSQSATRKGMGL